MKTLSLAASLTIASALCVSPSIFAATSAEADTFNPTQVKQIQQVTHDYLVKNPQVLVEASQALQQQEMQKVQANAHDSISKNAKALFNDSASPVFGNPQGDVTIVEFMDYQCGHCKSMAPVIEQLTKKDAQLRVVIKELPIFGETSEYAAKAALAAQKQGKFLPFSQALMAATAPLSHDQVMQIAQSVGLNTQQLQQDMQNTAYDQQLQANMQLAQALGLMGTPAFIIGNRQGSQNTLVPGATSIQNLQHLVTQTRGSNSKQ